MSKIAQLGFKVDSTPLKVAQKDLKELRKEGERAPKWMRAMASNAKIQADAMKRTNYGKSSVDLSKYGNQASIASAKVSRFGNNSRKAANDVRTLSKSTGGLGSKLLNIKNIIAGGIFAGLARTAVGAIDGLKNVNALLNIVSTSTADFKRTQLELFQVAQANYASIKDTTKLYAGQAKQLGALGYQHAQQIKAVDLFSKALATSGATTAEASAATLQWVQGLGSGILRGQEFNSIMENGRGVAIALADGLHTTIGNLRNMALEGKLTAKVVVDALLSQNDAIRDKFAKIPITIGKAWQQMRNSATVALSKVNDAIGDATGGIANFISKVAKSIDSVDFNKIITGAKIFSVILASRLLPAIVSTITRLSIVNLALAGYAVRTTIAAGATAMLSRGMALLGGPIGIIALVVGSLVAFGSTVDDSKTSTDNLRTSNERIQSSIKAVTDLTYKASKAGFVNVGALKAQAKATEELALTQAQERINKARVALSKIESAPRNSSLTEGTGGYALAEKKRITASKRARALLRQEVSGLTKLKDSQASFARELEHTAKVQNRINGGEAEAIEWKKKSAIALASQKKLVSALLDKTKEQARVAGKSGVELAKLSPIYQQMSDSQQKAYLANIRHIEGMKGSKKGLGGLKGGIKGVISEYDKLVGSMTKNINNQTLSHLARTKLTSAYIKGTIAEKANLEGLARQQDILEKSKKGLRNQALKTRDKSLASMAKENRERVLGFKLIEGLTDAESRNYSIKLKAFELAKRGKELVKSAKNKAVDLSFKVGVQDGSLDKKGQRLADDAATLAIERHKMIRDGLSVTYTNSTIAATASAQATQRTIESEEEAANKARSLRETLVEKAKTLQDNINKLRMLPEAYLAQKNAQDLATGATNRNIIALEAQQKKATIAKAHMDKVADANRGFIGSLLDGNSSVNDFFGNLIKKAALARLEMSLIGKDGTSGAFGGFLSSIFGSILPSSKGNLISPTSGIIPHSKGGLISQTGIFGMGGGKIGSIAENAPEFIMPAYKAANGDMGVKADINVISAPPIINYTPSKDESRGDSKVININYAPSIHVEANSDKSYVNEVIAENYVQFKKEVPDLVEGSINKGSTLAVRVGSKF